MHNKIYLGNHIAIIFSLLYVINTALALTYVEASTQNISPLLMLWLTAVVATTLMHLLCLKNIFSIYTKLFHFKKQFLIQNISVFFVVLSSYFASSTVGAANYLIAYFTINGLISTYIARECVASRVYYIAIACYISALFWILYFILQHDYGIFSIILTAIGALSGILYSRSTQYCITNTSFTALEMLITRYWLVIILLPLAIIHFSLPIDYGIIKTALTFHNIGTIALIAVIALITPLYFNQKALQKLHYTHVMIINSFTPCVAVIINIFTYHYQASHLYLFVICLLIFIATYITVQELE